MQQISSILLQANFRSAVFQCYLSCQGLALLLFHVNVWDWQALSTALCLLGTMLLLESLPTFLASWFLLDFLKFYPAHVQVKIWQMPQGKSVSRFLSYYSSCPLLSGTLLLKFQPWAIINPTSGSSAQQHCCFLLGLYFL